MTVRIIEGDALLPRVERGEPFDITIDGQPAQAYPGETIAAALQAAGAGTRHAMAWRGLYCGIGVCFVCLVTVDGVPGVRACVTPARPGMHIITVDGPREGRP